MSSDSPAATGNDNGHTDASLDARLLPSRRPQVSSGERFLRASAKVLHQLPTGSVMVFQVLSWSFTNQGERQPWWFSFVLVTSAAVSSVVFSLTDSFIYQGEVYYGVALPGRLFLFILSHRERRAFTDLHRDQLKQRGLQWDDCLHGFIVAVVFLAFAFRDVGIQNSFFPQAGWDAKRCLEIMPLRVAVLSSFLLWLRPTRRNNKDYLGRCTVHPSVTPPYFPPDLRVLEEEGHLAGPGDRSPAPQRSDGELQQTTIMSNTITSSSPPPTQSPHIKGFHFDERKGSDTTSGRAEARSRDLRDPSRGPAILFQVQPSPTSTSDTVIIRRDTGSSLDGSQDPETEEERAAGGGWRGTSVEGGG